MENLATHTVTRYTFENTIITPPSVRHCVVKKFGFTRDMIKELGFGRPHTADFFMSYPQLA